MTSKEAISTLQELGEFVRGASSTVEPPVAKKLKESPQAQELPALGLSMVKPCFSMVSTKSMVAPLR